MSMGKEVKSRTIAGILTGIALTIIWAFWDSMKPGFLAAWNWVWSTIIAFAMWFFDDVRMQRWFFLLILAVALAAIIGKIRAAWVRSRLPKGPTVLDFVEFERFGAVWKWHWGPNGVRGLNGYCPVCQRCLRYREDMALFNPEPTEFFCTNCPRVKFRRNGKFSSTANDVMIEIDHAVRTGEWSRYVSQTAEMEP